MQKSECRCMHHHTVAIFLVLIGLLYLLKNMGFVDPHTSDLVWPIIVVVVGLQRLFGSKCKCCKGQNNNQAGGCCSKNDVEDN